MPELLETIAASDAAALRGWAAAFAEAAPKLDALPPGRRAGELLALARALARRATWAADTAESFLAELVAGLQAGMGGHTFRDLVTSGRELCRLCRAIVSSCADVCRRAGPAGAPAEVVKVIEAAAAAAEGRLAAVERQVEALARKAFAPRPAWDEERAERGRRQLAEGKGLTREQALAALRKAE